MSNDQYAKWTARTRRLAWVFLLMIPIVPLLCGIVGGLVSGMLAPASGRAGSENVAEKMTTVQETIKSIRESLDAYDKKLSGLALKVKEKASPVNTEPDSQVTKLEQDLTQARMDLSGLEKTLGSLAKTVEEKLKADNGKGKGKDHEALTQEIDKLQKALASVREKLTPDALKAADLKPLDIRIKALEDELKKPKTNPGQDKLGKALKESHETLRMKEKQLEDRDSKLKAAVEEQERLKRLLPKVEPTDILVMALHSSNLSLHNYLDVFREYVDPGKRIQPEGCRVAFALAEGGDTDLVVPFEGANSKAIAKKFSLTVPARKGTTDRLSEMGSWVRKEFEMSKATHRRCIVVASAACQTVPRKEIDDWKGVQVHVILIGSDKKLRELEPERMQEWNDFCRRSGGWLTLLSTPDRPEERDDNLVRQLRNCLELMTLPRRKP